MSAPQAATVSDLDYALFGIKNTLAKYCVALDDQKFDLLNQVFHVNVRTDYTAVRPSIGVVTGRQAVIDRLKSVLEGKRTQHGLSTQHVMSLSAEKCTIRSYFTANTFEMLKENGDDGQDGGAEDGELRHTTVFGFYDDELVYVGERDSLDWRIYRRKLGMHHPRIVNKSALE